MMTSYTAAVPNQNQEIDIGTLVFSNLYSFVCVCVCSFVHFFPCINLCNYHHNQNTDLFFQDMVYIG